MRLETDRLVRNVVQSQLVGNEPDGRFFSPQNGYTMVNDLGLEGLNVALAKLGHEAIKAKLSGSGSMLTCR